MDVNKPDSVRPVGDKPHRSPPERHHDQPDSDEGETGAGHGRPRGDAVDLGGALSAGIPPATQKILDAFAAQMEQLRGELDAALKRAEHDHGLALAHSFLPVPNRREFLREVSHVIDHMADGQPAPVLLIAHAAAAGDIRRRFGRRAADAALTRLAEALQAAVHPADAVGNLGGDDFGAILLIEAAEDGGERAHEIAEVLSGLEIPWGGAKLALTVHCGWAEVRRGDSADQAMAAADAVLLDGFRR